MYVGWDWGNTTHAVAVIDDQGQVIDRWPCPHTEDGIRATLARLASHGPPARLPVAIETTRGLVIDRLLTAGHPVARAKSTAACTLGPIEPAANSNCRIESGSAALIRRRVGLSQSM